MITGTAAFDLLSMDIAGTAEPTARIIPTSFVERESTAPPP